MEEVHHIEKNLPSAMDTSDIITLILVDLMPNRLRESSHLLNQAWCIGRTRWPTLAVYHHDRGSDPLDLVVGRAPAVYVGALGHGA